MMLRILAGGSAVIVFAILTVLSACTKEDVKLKKNWFGGLIAVQGSYKIAALEQTINVWVDKQNLVKYSITDSTGKTLFLTQERPSAYHKWFFFYDSKGRLWFESGDIGCSVVKSLPDGKYQEVLLYGESNLVKEMPDEFFSRLPESTQKKWNVLRK